MDAHARIVQPCVVNTITYHIQIHIVHHCLVDTITYHIQIFNSMPSIANFKIYTVLSHSLEFEHYAKVETVYL